MRIYKSGAILGGLCAVLVFLGVHSVGVLTAASLEMQPIEELPVLIIDAGHGGFDGGAVGTNGIIEKEINLAIAKNLRDLFTVHGFEVMMTREEDRSTESPGLSTTRQRKASDIKNRAALAAAQENGILLSIHQNKFPQAQSFGAQVFYGPQNEQSKQMGEIMQKTLVEQLDPQNHRKAKACGDSVYLIHHAKLPALLIECGFLSNAEEARKLIDPAYQRDVSFAIFSGVVQGLGLDATDILQAEQPPQE